MSTLQEARAPVTPGRTYRWVRLAGGTAWQYVPAFVTFIALLIVWQVITARYHLVAAYLLPAPLDIAKEMGNDKTILLQQTWATTKEIIVGYFLGVGMGVGFALMIFYSRLLERVVYPFVLTTQYVPKLAIAPLIIVWFGLGIWPKVLVTALVCMFPIMINTLVGLRGSDARLIELMHLLNANRWQVFRMIRLPGAIPHIFAGLKVGITLATIGAIVAEWIASDSGLGYLIVFSLGYFHTTELYAALVMLTALGLVLFGLVVLAERLLTPHQPHLEITEM